MDGTLLNKKLKIEEKLAQLNEIAQKVDDMPVFTSNDRAFLEELPGFPVMDGKKVLTATTESGETSLSYEEQESGVVNYSTTEQATGQKWIDGKEIYVITAQNVQTWTVLATGVDKVINAVIARHGKSENTAYKVFGDGFVQNDGGTIKLEDGVARYSSWSSDGDLLVTTADHVILYYTKAEVTKKRTSKK